MYLLAMTHMQFQTSRVSYRFHLRVHKHTVKDRALQVIMLNVSPCGNEHQGVVHSTRRELYLFIIRKTILALMKPSCSSSTAG